MEMEPGQETTSTDKEPTYEAVVEILSHIKNLRGLGHQLHIPTGDLNALDQYSGFEERREKFFNRWRDLHHNFSWAALREALLAPQFEEYGLVEKITKRFQDHSLTDREIRKQSSADSAISVSSPTSPLTMECPYSQSSATVAVSQQSDTTSEECNILNVVNWVYSVGCQKFSWRRFGEYFRFQSELNVIEKSYPKEEYYVRAIELWYQRTTEDDRTWEQLEKGLVPPQKSSRRKSANNDTAIRSDADISKEIKELKHRFDSLRDAVRKYLDDKKKDVADVHDTLSFNSDLQVVYSEIFDKKFHTLSKCEDFRQFFRSLAECLNFVDFHLLECVIEEHGSTELNSKMKEYRRDLEKFLKSTTVDQLIRLWVPRPKYKPELLPTKYREYVVQLDRHPETCTLEELEDLRSATRYSIQDAPLLTAAMVLFDVSDGSVTVVWKVQEGVVEVLSVALSRLIESSSDFIERYKILVLLLDDYILFPFGCIEQMFWNACREGNFPLVKECLNTGADPNYVCEVSGWTVLMCVTKYGHLSILQLLMESGAEVDAQDKAGCTALNIAAQVGRYDVAEMLMERGADPNIADTVCGLTPLMVAIDRRDQPLIKLLYKRADLSVASREGKTPLILAVEKKVAKAIDLFLSEDVVERICIDHRDVRGRTAVHAAVESGNLEVVKQLITISPEARDIEDMDGNKPTDLAFTHEQHDIAALLSPDELREEEAEGVASQEQPERGRLQRLSSSIRKFFKDFRPRDIKLMRAAKAGNHTAVEQLLVRDHADPNTREVDYLRWTPLMWAGYKGHTETVKVLLKNKADPNKTANNGYTALILASGRGHHEVVAALLDPSNPIPADPNVRNSTRGWSALMWACQSNRIAGQSKSDEGKLNRRKVVQHLLAAKADVNLPTKNGWTPIMQASQDGDAELVKILCEAPGVNIDHQSETTWSALTTACRKKYEDIVKVLVEHGATVSQKKKGGVTAMHIASYYNLKEAMRYMAPTSKEGVDVQDDWGMTPLIMAAKQDHAELVQYFVTDTKADLNIQAEKYAKWSALFFVIKNGNQKTADFLIVNGADPYLIDKYEHNSLTYSKLPVLGKRARIYKQLVQKLYPEDTEAEPSPTPQHEDTPETESHSSRKPVPIKRREDVDRKERTAADTALYTSIEALWRTRQLPNIALNV